MRQNKFEKLSDADLWSQTKIAALKEKEATLLLLDYLAEVERRRLFAEKAYSSLFEFMVKELHYSESQSAERISAMRLMKDVSEVKDMIQSGALSLTTASQIQKFIKAEKKVSNIIKHEEKINLIEQCKNQSKRTVERILIQSSSEKFELPAQKERTVSPEFTELKFLVSEDDMKKLKELKDFKDISFSDIFSAGLDSLLHKAKAKNELKNKTAYKSSKLISTQKVTLPAEFKDKQESKNSYPQNSSTNHTKLQASSRFIAKSVRAAVVLRSKNRCEYHDPVSKKRCSSTYRLQFEHSKPFALGGESSVLNLKHYCFAHNQLAAIKSFGRKKMEVFMRGE